MSQVDEKLLELLQQLSQRSEQSQRVFTALEQQLPQITEQFQRIANVLAPAPSDIVASRYVADALGCSNVWVAAMARKGDIPPSCVVQGTGNGKVWKFHRAKIDAWMKERGMPSSASRLTGR